VGQTFSQTEKKLLKLLNSARHWHFTKVEELWHAYEMLLFCVSSCFWIAN